MVRWPGHIEAGQVLTGMFSHSDWFTTLLAAAGEPDIADKLKEGHELDGHEYRVHLDGFNQLPYLTGDVDEGPRFYFFYVTDDADLAAMRYHNFKFVFLEQRVPGTMKIWSEPMVELRMPKIFNLRTDPYEKADITSNTYYDWVLDHAFLFVPAQSFVAEHLQTLVEFPPRQKPASFSIDQLLEKLQAGMTSS